MTHRDTNRCGVTLLEVLFSMLIAAIGLLGAIALLPVAIEQANRGRQADAQAIAGEAAVSDFKVRGYHDWNNWVTWDQANSRFIKSLNFTQGICFDPLMVSQAHFNVSPNLNNNYRLFPAVGTGPQMIRVGLWDVTQNVNTVLPVQFPFAETCVKNFDELNYNRPQDRSQEAFQLYSSNNLRRQINPAREYSWFATLAPAAMNSDEFILAIVMMYKRQLPDVAPPGFPVPAGTADNHEERFVAVAFNGTGDTGGEVTLSANSNDSKYLDLQKGNWIMLKGIAGGINQFRWYRVIDTEPTVQGSAGNFTRQATLFGADWPSSVQTQGVIVRGVTAVYERTIRLQQSNLWQ